MSLLLSVLSRRAFLKASATGVASLGTVGLVFPARAAAVREFSLRAAR